MHDSFVLQLKKKRVQIVFLFVVTLMLLITASCGKSNQETNSSPNDQEANLTQSSQEKSQNAEETDNIRTLCYRQAEPVLDGSSPMFGDGIYGLCKNATIRNNYVHDIDCVAMSFEYFGEENGELLIDGGIYDCEDNVIVNCGEGIGLNDFGNDDNNPSTKLDQAIIKNNIVLDLQTGWVNGALCDAYCLSVLDRKLDLTVTGNYFWCSHHEVIQFHSSEKQKSVDIHDNVYGQYEDRLFMYAMYSPYFDIWTENEELSKIMKQYWGENEPNIYILQE